MSAQLDHDGGRRIASGLIDVTVPNAARASDFLQGGQANFAADRKAAAALVESAPSIAAIPASARAFRRRVVRYLAADAGIGQFLDVGDGLVPPGNTHEVAQAVDPSCRIVYVESDPMMVDRTRATLASAPGGLVACVEGDIADVNGIVSAAGLSEPGLPAADTSGAAARTADPADLRRPGDGAILDPGQPIAVLLLSTLAHVPSAADAAKVVADADGLRAVRQLPGDPPPGQRPRPGAWRRTQAVERGRRRPHRAPFLGRDRRPGDRPRPGRRRGWSRSTTGDPTSPIRPPRRRSRSTAWSHGSPDFL